MKIYILDRDEESLEFARLWFLGEEDVECVCAELDSFLRENPVQFIVSPANAFGLMDGGYDLAITRYFGDQLQERVQQHIIERYYGEQPVGTSFMIDAGKEDRKLIHTPTMRAPQLIREPLVIYQCMRTSLMCAMEHGAESVLLPMFGCGAGYIHPKTVAELMWKAYDQLRNPPKKLDWQYVINKQINVDCE